MIESLTWTFTWDAVDNRAAAKSLRRNFEPHWALSVGIFAAGLLAAIFIGLAIARYPQPEVTMFGFAIGILSMNLVLRIRSRKIQAVTRAAPQRQGEMSTHASDKGIEIKGQGIRSSAQWSAIAEVREARGMILLCLSGMEFFPLPDSALPDGITHDDAHRLLKGWHTAARHGVSA
jgi:hypothetical protein